MPVNLLNYRLTGVVVMQIVDHQELSQKVLFTPDLEKIIGRNRLTLRRWWLSGKFPKPVKLHGNTLAWSANIIEEWLEKNLMANKL